MRRGILATRDELRALAALTGRKAFVDIHAALRKRCALILECAPVAETQWRTLWMQGQWASALQAARTAQGRVLDLLIAHHIDPNPAYRDRAIEEVKTLARWGAWADPCYSHMPADLCTAEAAVAVAVGLDWLWEDLSEADRSALLEALRTKAILPFLDGAARGALWANCYHAWNAVVNGGVGLAAMALADQDEQARKACRLARAHLEKFFAALDRDGGWDEGPGYWAYAMRYILLLAEAARRLEDDEGLYHRRGMNATGQFGVYFTPNGQPAGFGDGSVSPPPSALYLLARRYDCRQVTWWLDTYGFHRDVRATGWSAAGLSMLFRPPGARTPRRPSLKTVKVFPTIGWAALADSWPRPTFYVAAKTGDLSANHSQRDMNSIQLQVDGEMLLRDLPASPEGRESSAGGRSDLPEVQARAHNTVVVAERDHRIDAQGKIIESRNGRRFRYVACDAGNACGESTTFCRHVVMAVDPARQAGTMLIVLDDLSNGTPEKVEAFWHTEGDISLDRQALAGAIAGRKAALHFAVASTVRTTAFVETRQVGPRPPDNVLHLSAGVIGRVLTASVFSRRRLAGGVHLAEQPDGAVVVQAGKVHLRFLPAAGHLRLQTVAEGPPARPSRRKR